MCDRSQGDKAIELIPLGVRFGAPRVRNIGYVYRKSRDIMAVGVHTISHNCQIEATGGDDGFPMVVLSATKYSRNLRKTGPRTAPAYITLKTLKGWSVWSASVSKDHVAICLVRDTV